LQKFAAAGAAAIIANGVCGIRAQPMTTGFAQWIDALHREAWQILHRTPSEPPCLG